MRDGDLLWDETESLADDLMRGLDPLAVDNEDELDRARRRRAAGRRVAVALREYDRLVATSHAVLVKGDWVRGSAMNYGIQEPKPSKADPLLQIALDLAKALDPKLCEGLKAEGFDPKLVSDKQQDVIRVAMGFVSRIYAVTEQESLAYLFHDKTHVA